MKGLRPTLESVAKEGVTSHKRIKEGETPAAETPATGSFADFMKTKKKP